VHRLSRPEDRCSTEEHTCSSTSVDYAHLGGDCSPDTAAVCSAQEHDAPQSSTCEVVHILELSV